MIKISEDFQTAIEALETLRRNFQRICDEHPSHLDPLNRYAKGHHAGYLAALGAAIDLVRSTAEMQATYGIPGAAERVCDNVINLIDALKRTEEQQP